MSTTELTPKQQFAELVRKGSSFFLTTHVDPAGDGLGSTLALARVLTKLGKKVTVAIDGNIGAQYYYLPGIETVIQDYSEQKNLLVIIDESQAKVDNVSLKRVSDTKMMVIITPKDGVLTADSVRIEDGSYEFDAVFVLDTPSKDRLGSLHERCAELFYDLPVITIDHHPSNTNFGKINLVDMAASSTSEMVVSLIEMLGRDQAGLLDEQVATCLLTGIIADTSCFQDASTTPKSLTVAAQLVAAGAKQQEIVRELFKNRSLSMLRLWGRALSYIKEDATGSFAWSTLSKADFVASQAVPEMATTLLDELLKTASGVDFVLLLTEDSSGITGHLRSVLPTCDVRTIAVSLGGSGSSLAASFHTEGKLQEKEQEIITQVRNLVTEGTTSLSE